MSQQPASNPGPRSRRPVGAESFIVAPFTRLARTHAVAAAGDAAVTLALAGSLFLSIDASAARGRVALYLILTMAPFALVSPLLGPAIDRAQGGRKWMIVGSVVLRAVIAALMVRDLDSYWLFPESFLMLVLAKGYHVAKSAVVPSTVGDESELVEANSKLALLSAIAGAAGIAIAAPFLWLGGSEGVAAVAAVLFVIAGVFSLRITNEPVAEAPPDATEVLELKSLSIRLAATAMGTIRGLVGFMTFLLMFLLRVDEESVRPGQDAGTPWQLGVVFGASGLGAFVGAGLAPRLRRQFDEEQILMGALATVAAVGIIAATAGTLIGGVLIAFTVTMTASTAKMSFDALVQQDAPDANQGRSFAKFETRFQILWVIGAFLPVVIPILVPIPAWLGFVIISLTAAGAAVWYWLGLRGDLPESVFGSIVHAVSATAEGEDEFVDDWSVENEADIDGEVDVRDGHLVDPDGPQPPLGGSPGLPAPTQPNRTPGPRQPAGPPPPVRQASPDGALPPTQMMPVVGHGPPPPRTAPKPTPPPPTPQPAPSRTASTADAPSQATPNRSGQGPPGPDRPSAPFRDNRAKRRREWVDDPLPFPDQD